MSLTAKGLLTARPVTGSRNRGPLEDLNNSKLNVYESQSDSPDHPGSISYHSESSEVPYVFHKPVTGQELFFAVCYSKPALREYWEMTNNVK